MICALDVNINSIRTPTTLLTALVLTAGFVSPAFAQSFTGRIDVTIEDSTGGRLPGVRVELTGPVDQVQTSDAQGQSHFLNLPVGQYGFQASLTGFNPYSNVDVQVASGAATPVHATLGVAGTAETVHVTAATSILDATRETTTTHFTLEELQNIPTARDPWVMIQMVPTIYADRVNVGGSAADQESNYIGKGSAGTDNTWSLDGVPITDMSATRSTPTYDFDMFQEMAITTGGADARNPTPGVQLNLVLKKGANTPHGSTRFYFENERLQGNNLPAGVAQATGSTSAACVDSNYLQHCGNRTDQYKDYGIELGGPVLKDQIWAWGSIARTSVTNLAITGQSDSTLLENYAVKADAKANSSVRGIFTLFTGDKIKSGLGFDPTSRLIETAWNLEGPTKYAKGEGNFVVGQKLFASARYAHISSGFQLTPVGGLDKDFYNDDANVWHNSYYYYTTDRPQYFVGGDASYFAGRHEMKFGFSWRKTPVDSTSQVTGHKIVTIWTGYPKMIAQAQQDFNENTTGRYTSGYITDTISMNRLTVIAGARFDRQTSSYAATHADAVPNFPLLPAIDSPAIENAYDFKNLTPRVGLTYALDASHKTIGRVSYAMFASQLPANAASFVSPIQPDTFVDYNAVDKNGNGVADLSEIDFRAGVKGSNNVDLAHPGVVSTSNRIGNIRAPRTQELMFGVDRELRAGVGVSATMTYRYMNNFLWNPANGLTAASYQQSGTFTGTFANVGTVSIPFYAASGVQPGFTAQNRPDYHRRYVSVEVSATKRMSNHWTARVGAATTSWNEYFDSPAAILDKTPTSAASGQYASLQTSGPLVNGGPVVVSSSGSGTSGIFLLSPKYQLMANGMYQAPWGIDLGANLNLRQGYGEPFFMSRVATGDPVLGNKSLLLTTGADQFRLDSVAALDVRVEKVLKFGTSSLALDFDVFNLTNNAVVLGKQYDARSASFNSTLEIMNPRIARLGVRFSF